ncbi:hypothetical protein H6G36_19200 [Anabaena minutissima FACHB-250]|nr:hypothetical protein [Anabaena minutissima FACHB-250]
MFGFIKKLIAGILSFITGLLPGKKNGGYYLQLEETGTGSAPVAETKTKSAVETSNGTKAAVEAPQPEPSPTPVKAAKKKASQNGKAAPTEPAPVPVPAASTKPATPTETTFAPKYLIPTFSSSNGRRRPGANMNTYLDMARQVKTPG